MDYLRKRGSHWEVSSNCYVIALYVNCFECVPHFQDSEIAQNPWGKLQTFLAPQNYKEIIIDAIQHFNCLIMFWGNPQIKKTHFDCRDLPIASTSSMYRMQGASFLARLNKSLTLAEPTPENTSTKSEPAIVRKGTSASVATALASRVLPVPGGPTRRAP